MKLMRLINVCLTETYSRVWVGKNLSDRLPTRNGLKQGDALSPLFFKRALEYVIRSVQASQVGLKLNGTHQLLEIGLEVNFLSKGGKVQIFGNNLNTSKFYSGRK